MKDRHALRVGKQYDDFFDGGTAQLIQVDQRNFNDYLGYAIWFNQTNDFSALQLIWTDRKNKYPWDDGFEEEFIGRQPLLDRNADFKFREERNVAVFTTRQWLEEEKPIVHVVHDDEGDWQFLTGDQTLEDIKIVALEEIISRDPTLNDVFNLDYGEAAERRFIGDKWIRDRVDGEE